MFGKGKLNTSGPIEYVWRFHTLLETPYNIIPCQNLPLPLPHPILYLARIPPTIIYFVRNVTDYLNVNF